MLTVDDGIMRLRMKLNQQYGQGAVNLRITVGTEYQWGWSLYFQDTRPEHFLVGHGPTFFNKTNGELIQTGSACSEEDWVTDYEYAIGQRTTFRLLVRQFTRSEAHLRHGLVKSGLTLGADLKSLPVVVFAGGRAACEGFKERLREQGVESDVVPDHTTDPQRLRRCGL